MNIETTQYYDEFIRYFEMAQDQQEKCNTSTKPPFGMIDHSESEMNDDLMEKVTLYDVVERKLAGFSQIVNDCFYGWSDKHPYWPKMQAGKVTRQREMVAHAWTGKHSDFDFPEWLYIFILHRVCGSAINYATQPSGYHNTILFDLHKARTIEEMAKMVNSYPTPFYTSVGYQFPAFPKPPEGSSYKRNGDYFLTEFAPRLAREMAEWLQKSNSKKDLREMGEWMFDWNKKNGLRVYQFQYAAVLADIADWYPQYVNLDSMFYYGTNARECISYLATPTQKMSQDQFLDRVMEKIYADTKSLPYNAEDVCCDFIRWVENYVRPGAHYDHLDFDGVWSSCRIKDHPFGRQRPMLGLGLVKSFNGMTAHPSDDKIIREAGLTVEKYKELVRTMQ
jgi:hypothetical protein